MKKTLIVYYTQNAGNTKYIAEALNKKIESDIIQINTVIPYTGSMEEISAQAQKEVNEKFKPEIAPNNIDISSYDTIIIGTPTWWYTMSPAIRSFLNSHNWNGKKVVLFSTHAGWAGHCLLDMQNNCEGAEVISTQDFRFTSDGGSGMVALKTQIDDWVSSILEKN